jgi:protease-4
MPPPYYPPPARHSFTRGILVTLATTVFGLSLLANFYLLMLVGARGAGATQTNVLVDGDSSRQIAVIPINDVITEATARSFDRWMEQAQADKSVKAVVLEVNSPGGEVTASDMIHQRIQKFRTESKKPVVVSMGSLATSGGYYVSAGADHIVASPTTITGNIGVLMSRYNLSGMAQKLGVEDATIHSTGADFKDAGSMLRPETPEERAYFLGLIDDAFVQFKTVITNGRGPKLTDSIDRIANGKAYSAKEALRLGLIDQVGYPGDAYAKAEGLAGGSGMRVIRYERRRGLMDEILWPEASAKQGSAGSLHLHLDASVLENALVPRLMYIWRGQ